MVKNLRAVAAPVPLRTIAPNQSGYVPKREGEKGFVARHGINTWDDPYGNSSKFFQADNINMAPYLRSPAAEMNVNDPEASNGTGPYNDDDPTAWNPGDEYTGDEDEAKIAQATQDQDPDDNQDGDPKVNVNDPDNTDADNMFDTEIARVKRGTPGQSDATMSDVNTPYVKAPSAPSADDGSDGKVKDLTATGVPKGTVSNEHVVKVGDRYRLISEKNWIAGAVKHPGALTAAAKRAGESNSEYEQAHAHSSGKAGERARFALNMKKINHEEEQLDEGPTRKDFQQVANTVRAIEDPKERQKFADHHAGIFSKQNPRFNHDTWHSACGTKRVSEEAIEETSSTPFDPKEKPVIKDFKKATKEAKNTYKEKKKLREVAELQESADTLVAEYISESNQPPIYRIHNNDDKFTVWVCTEPHKGFVQTEDVFPTENDAHAFVKKLVWDAHKELNND